MKPRRGSARRMGYTPAGYADNGGYTGAPTPSIFRMGTPRSRASWFGISFPRPCPAGTRATSSPPGSTIADLIAWITRCGSGFPAWPCGHAISAILYLGQGGRGRLRARRAALQCTRQRCVLASWNMMIPLPLPGASRAAKAALRTLVKTPLVYTQVALRDWTAFQRLESPGTSRRRAATTSLCAQSDNRHR